MSSSAQSRVASRQEQPKMIERHLFPNEMGSLEGLRQVHALLTPTHIAAVKAQWDSSKNRYRLMGLTDPEYQELRRKGLESKYHSTFHPDREAIHFTQVVTPFARDRKELVFVWLPPDYRVYHY